MSDALEPTQLLYQYWRSVRESNTLLYSALDLQSNPLPSGPPTKSIIEFVYLSDFSATASIPEDAHLSLFKVVTRSLVPLFHCALKNPPCLRLEGSFEFFDVY